MLFDVISCCFEGRWNTFGFKSIFSWSLHRQWRNTWVSLHTDIQEHLRHIEIKNWEYFVTVVFTIFFYKHLTLNLHLYLFDYLYQASVCYFQRITVQGEMCRENCNRRYITVIFFCCDTCEKLIILVSFTFNSITASAFTTFVKCLRVDNLPFQMLSFKSVLLLSVLWIL